MKEKLEGIKLTLKGGGLSYEKEVNVEVASRIMTLCLSPTKENLIQPEDVSSRSLIKESPAEYLNRLSPRRNPDKILTFCGYLKEVSGKDSSHPSEIKRLFRDAGEILPANFSRDFDWVVSNGWVASDPNKKDNFYITNTGIKVLKEGFSNEVIKKSKLKRAKNTARK